jgi:hypothetical protein
VFAAEVWDEMTEISSYFHPVSPSHSEDESSEDEDGDSDKEAGNSQDNKVNKYFSQTEDGLATYQREKECIFNDTELILKTIAS